jgi:hypothetical protein
MFIALVAGLVLVVVPAKPVQAAVDEFRRGPGGPTGPAGNGFGTGYSASGTALTPLTDAEARALQDAILEEYGALNLYQTVIEQYGSVAPFVQIANSEQMHVNALVRQADKYGVEVPVNPGLESAPVFESLEEACQAGVDAEIADAALYDELMTVTDHADILRVYTRLQSASLDSHLPAFEACDCVLIN